MSLGATVRTSLRDADTAAGRVMRTPPLEWDFRVNRKRVESCHGKGDLTMPNAPYRIYAVRYAHRTCTTSEAFYGDYHKAPMTMDYFVWALTNGTETVVVDLGFTEDVGTRRGRQFLRCPGKGLAEIGVEAASVKHVILSHFHYDHVGTTRSSPTPPFTCRTPRWRFTPAATPPCPPSATRSRWTTSARSSVSTTTSACSSWTAPARSCPASRCTTWAATPRGCRSSRWRTRGARRWWPPTPRTTIATSRSTSPSTPFRICRGCTRRSRRSASSRRPRTWCCPATTRSCSSGSRRWGTGSWRCRS